MQDEFGYTEYCIIVGDESSAKETDTCRIWKWDDLSFRRMHRKLQSHLADFINAYNYGRRLKTLKGLTPDEFIAKTWTKDPERFTLNPVHQMPGLNI